MSRVFGRPKVVQMRQRQVVNNNIPVPQPLPGIQNVLVPINGQLVGDVEVLIRGEGGMIDAGVTNGRGWFIPFTPVDVIDIRSARGDMRRRGFALRDYEYYPNTPEVGQHTRTRGI